MAKVFNKNLYERIDAINGEERGFVERIDLGVLENIEYWVRNPLKVDPFYIRDGAKESFILTLWPLLRKAISSRSSGKAKTVSTTEDTAYKVEIAKEWENLSKGKLHFFLVHTGNTEEVLTQLKTLLEAPILFLIVGLVIAGGFILFILKTQVGDLSAEERKYQYSRRNFFSHS